jgi:hypothetical protein
MVLMVLCASPSARCPGSAHKLVSHQQVLRRHCMCAVVVAALDPGAITATLRDAPTFSRTPNDALVVADKGKRVCLSPASQARVYAVLSCVLALVYAVVYAVESP